MKEARTFSSRIILSLIALLALLAGLLLPIGGQQAYAAVYTQSYEFREMQPYKIQLESSGDFGVFDYVEEGVTKLMVFSPEEMYGISVWGSLVAYQGNDKWTCLYSGYDSDAVDHKNHVYDFKDIWGSSKTNTYLINSSALYLYDGSALTPVAGVQNPARVWGTAADDIYVARSDAGLYHYDGASWSLVEGMSGVTVTCLGGLSPTQVYAGTANGLYGFDGASWSQVESGSAATCVGATADGKILACYGKTVKCLADGQWTSLGETPLSAAKIAGTALDDLYAVISGKLYLRKNDGNWYQIKRSDGSLLAATVRDFHVFARRDFLVAGLDAPNGGLYFDPPILYHGDTIPVPADADADREVTAYVRVEGYDHTIVPRTRVTLRAFDLGKPYSNSIGGARWLYLNPATGSSASYGAFDDGWPADRFENGPTALHILLKALTDQGFSRHDPASPVDGLTEFDVQDYGWSLYVAMIGSDREFGQGASSGWLYRVNGVLPNYGSQGYPLEDGDEVVWCYSPGGFNTWYTNFTADREEIAPGQTVNFTLSGETTDLSGSSGAGETVVQPIAGAGLLVDGQPWLVQGNPLVTDASGQAAITFDTPGTYEVSCSGWDVFGNDDAIRPASITITVSGEPSGINLQKTVAADGRVSLNLSTVYPNQPVTLLVTDDDSVPCYIDQFNTNGEGSASVTFSLPAGPDYLGTVRIGDEKQEFDITIAAAEPEDNTPPSFAAGYPKAENIADDHLTLKIMLNEAGTAYYNVVADNAAPGSDYADWNAVTAAGGSEVSAAVGNLAAETAYDIYLIAKDSAGNMQAAPVKLEVTTQAINETIARVRDAIDLTTAYVKSNPTYSSDWMVVGLKNAGQEIPASYLTGMEATVQNYFTNYVNTSSEKVTDHERRVLGIAAAGGDPRNIGGHDLLERIYNFRVDLATPRDITFQGLNGLIYGLVALDCKQYTVPGDALYSRDYMIEYLLNHQNADGGWDLNTSGRSDVDITAMVLTGLAPYHDRSNVMSAINQGVGWLSENQSEEGGYASWGSINSESVSQAIIALCANGIDPTSADFTKSGSNLLDALLTFQQANGSILHMLDGSGDTGMATEQGYQALLAYDKFVRCNGAYNGGQTSIYYFGDSETSDTTPPVLTVTGLTDNATVYTAALSFTAQAADAVDGAVAVTVKLNGVVVSGQSGSYSLTLASGRNTVTISAADADGNTASQTYTIKYSTPVTGNNVTISEDGSNKSLAITSDTVNLGEEVAITVPSSVTDATINVQALLNAPTGETITTSPLPALNISAATSQGQIKVDMPAGMVISAPASSDWDALINLPAVQSNSSVTVTPDSGKTATVNSVIEVGAGDIPLTFDQAVRLFIPGQARKDAGFSRDGTFAKISTVLSADSQAAANALPEGGEGKIDVDGDLVIWTKHFTSFVTYTQSANNSNETENGGSETSNRKSVYIRVEGNDGTIVPRRSVSVDNFDLTPYLGSASGSSAEPSSGWGPEKLTQPTVAHALITALEQAGINCCDHSGGLDLQDYGWSLYVAMINGEREFDHRSTSGWMYQVNGSLPGFGCQVYNLQDGDEIVWYFGVYGFETWYAELSASKTSLKTGEETTLTLTGVKTDLSASSGAGSSSSAKLKGAQIYVNDAEYQGIVTDENGQAKITFSQAGTYKVSAERFTGEGFRDMVRPLPVTITVSGASTEVPASQAAAAIAGLLADPAAGEAQITAAVKAAAEGLKSELTKVKTAEEAKSLLQNTASITTEMNKAADRTVSAEAARQMSASCVEVMDVLSGISGQAADAESKQAMSESALSVLTTVQKVMGSIADKAQLEATAVGLIGSSAAVIKALDAQQAQTVQSSFKDMVQKAVQLLGQDTLPQDKITVEGNEAKAVLDAAYVSGLAVTAAQAVKNIEQKLAENGLEMGVSLQKTVSIQIQSPGQSLVETSLPAGLMQNPNLQGVELQIETSVASFALTSQTFGKAAQGQEIKLSAASLESKDLPASLPAGSLVVNLDAQVGGAKVDKFEQPIEVKIPITGEVQNQEAVTVFLLKDDGSLEAVGGKYDPSAQSVKFLTSHFSKYFAKESIKQFNDLDNLPWARNAVEIMAGKGIIAGKSSTGFDPEADVTRAEFASLVTRMLKYEPDENADLPFKDVAPGSWYRQAVAASYQNGLINGTSADKFAPEASISRQEMARIIANVLVKHGYKAAKAEQLEKFSDQADIADWATEATALVVREGLIAGMEDGRFAPAENANRAQAAVMLYRLFNLIMQ